MCSLRDEKFDSYFSSTNKTIWSSIDQVLTDLAWHGTYNFVQVEYLQEVISYHIPILVSLPNYLKLATSFKYYDMWSEDPHFMDIIYTQLEKLNGDSKMAQLTLFSKISTSH